MERVPEVVMMARRSDYLKEIRYYRMDRSFRRANRDRTAEEMWPLSVGYSPFSGMKPLKKPERKDWGIE